MAKVFWKGKKVGMSPTTAPSSIGTHRGYPVPSMNFDLGTALNEFVARNKANQVESRPLVESWPEEYDELLKASDWKRLRRLLAEKASMEGMVYVLQLPAANGKKILSVMSIDRLNKVGGIVLSAELTTDQVYIKDNQPYPIKGKLYRESDGEVKFERYYYDDDLKLILLNETPYSFGHPKKLPGAVFYGNSQGVPDIDAAMMRGALEHLDFHSNELTEEWKYVLTRLTNNENFSDMDKDELAKLIANAERIIPITSVNSKLQEGQSIFTSGSQSLTLSQLNINFIEDKILKYTGVMRESTSTGSNKHSLEITLQNQFATEILFSLRDQREHDYKILFDSIAETEGFDDISDQIELKVSLIEEAKIALLQEAVEQAKNKGSMSKNRQQTQEE